MNTNHDKKKKGKIKNKNGFHTTQYKAKTLGHGHIIWIYLQYHSYFDISDIMESI